MGMPFRVALTIAGLILTVYSSYLIVVAVAASNDVDLHAPVKYEAIEK
ncbi:MULTISPECIES: hypothetical protein [Brochothrix]|uniref:Uncharacterized protein n=1 Tax=Brochothrix thermosphacta TaxID=2756 RepID=A0A2X0RM25_BROTH|nr:MULTISPECIES: hypothetical protein [Brochothrix]SLM90235.1 hypothetical protein FM106_01485 [Brachybacterium faecium]MBR5527139.1 hypothetical protein [Brochothrix sp.]WKK69397.1 hypothetical protein Q0G00_01820 [Brochothrix thermosphacta]SOC08896.1 hypothetical protein BTH160X_140046 [Brochothrix thermosphacta]SPN71104.1 protein of unknown function [Brochothrix thermosphacta]